MISLDENANGEEEVDGAVPIDRTQSVLTALDCARSVRNGGASARACLLHRDAAPDSSQQQTSLWMRVRVHMRSADRWRACSRRNCRPFSNKASGAARDLIIYHMADAAAAALTASLLLCPRPFGSQAPKNGEKRKLRKSSASVIQIARIPWQVTARCAHFAYECWPHALDRTLLLPQEARERRSDLPLAPGKVFLRAPRCVPRRR